MPDDKQSKQEPRSFEPGEEAGYATDTFSRNDREGRPPEGADMAGDDSAGAAAEPDAAPLKAADDADSRDAPPRTPPREGGVR
jgi:hypothetical protein